MRPFCIVTGKRNHFAAIEYALRYATERNKEFKEYDPNSANFCSQCLLAGGVEHNRMVHHLKAGFQVLYDTHRRIVFSKDNQKQLK